MCTVSCNDQHRCSLVKLAGIVVVAYFRWVKDLNKFVWRVAEIEISWRRPCRCQNGNRKVGNWVLVVWIFEFLRLSEKKVMLWLDDSEMCCWCLSVLNASPRPPPLLSLMLWLDDFARHVSMIWLSPGVYGGTWSIDELVLMQGA